jgi:hypothetical protein
MSMSKIRMVLLSGILTLMGALWTPSADAIKFEWKVNGVRLGAGETREFTAKIKAGNFILKTSIAGLEMELSSNLLKVQKGAFIIGGQPGTDEEKVEFEKVNVIKPAKCQVKGGGTVTTNMLKSEIVESAVAGVGTGKVDILFTPKEAGKPFVTFELENKGVENCLVGKTPISVDGNVLAEIKEQGTEVVAKEQIFEAPNKEYIISAGGAAKKAGLVVAGNAATLTGEAEIELVTKEKFGAF